MARGRHVKRTGLLASLWPRRRRLFLAPAPTVAVIRFTALEGEVARLRVLGIAHAAAAASADIRARRAEEQLTALRAELGLLREELVWAFAEDRLAVVGPVAVVDLGDQARTA